MNKMLQIWVSLCLIGLAGNIIPNVNQSFSTVDIVEYDSTADSNGIANSVLFSTPHPYLFLAENVHEIHSEVEPRNSANAGWTSLQNKFYTDVLYIQRSHSFSLSQAVRNMIFPFHSYL
ncbi:MAG: hypothetical protein WEA58_15290 [Balneolaceae bacterium]